MRLRPCTRSVTALLAAAAWLLAAAPASAQLPGSRLTNAGVVRATAQVDSVFQSRRLTEVTIDAGDFLAQLLARIGVQSFNDSSGFRVSADSVLVRVSGRLLDFPAEKRKELGPLLYFIDSTATFVAEISMPQRDSGIMRFRLERILLNGLAVPEVLLAPAVSSYASTYKELSAHGREFLVAMPPEARATLQKDRIRLWMRPAAPADSAKTRGGGPA